MLTLLSVVVISCKKKDEEPVAKTNYFTVDGKEYSFSQAITFEEGETPTGVFSFGLVIASSGVDFSQLEDIGIAGVGEILYLGLFSSSASGLVDGTYSYENLSWEQAKAKRYSDSFLGVNYDNQKETSDESYEDELKGNVIIKVDGDTYIIDFDLTLTNGKKVVGNFTGKLPNYPG